MSQIISFGQGGGGGGGDVLTLTGNTGGAVGPTGGNINVVGTGTISVAGNPGTSTLTISNTAQTVVTQVTTNDTPATLYSVTLANNSSVTVQVIINMALSDYTEAGYCSIIAGARRAGAGAVLIGVPSVSLADDFSSPVSIDGIVSGNNLIIQVVGIAAETITWRGVVTTVTLP